MTKINANIGNSAVSSSIEEVSCTLAMRKSLLSKGLQRVTLVLLHLLLQTCEAFTCSCGA